MLFNGVVALMENTKKQRQNEKKAKRKAKRQNDPRSKEKFRLERQEKYYYFGDEIYHESWNYGKEIYARTSLLILLKISMEHLNLGKASCRQSLYSS